MTKEKIQDYTRRISLANKTEMVVILYDILITYLEDATDALDREDFNAFSQELERSRNTLRELMNSVDTGSNLGRTLLRLYVFSMKELTDAFIKRNSAPLFEVMHIMRELREAYRYAGERDNSGSVMEHVETVYTGLTYNRNMRNESVINTNAGRGILA